MARLAARLTPAWRTQKAEREAIEAALAFQPVVRMAAASNAELVRRFVVAARGDTDEARLRSDAALEPLAALVASAAAGELAREAWPAAAADALTSVAPTDAATSVGELMRKLAARIPADAHGRRLRRALDEVRREPSAELRAPALVRLLGGAGGADEAQRLLLAEVAALAQPPLGLAGLLQQPLLASVEPAAAAEVSDAAASSDVARFLATAALARRGDQRGAKHGSCLTCEDGERVLGEGWNHRVYEKGGAEKGKQRVIHAECAAVADAVRNLGEERAFDLLQGATCWIVRLEDDSGYDDAPPCPQCELLLRACGVTKVVTSTRAGALVELALSEGRQDFLSIPNASRPLRWACDALGVRIARLDGECVECGR